MSFRPRRPPFEGSEAYRSPRPVGRGAKIAPPPRRRAAAADIAPRRLAPPAAMGPPASPCATRRWPRGGRFAAFRPWASAARLTPWTTLLSPSPGGRISCAHFQPLTPAPELSPSGAPWENPRQPRATGASYEDFSTGTDRFPAPRRPPSRRGSLAERSSHFPVKVTRKEMNTMRKSSQKLCFLM